jgi:5-methylcytosine-specific restriction enzyme A
MARSSASLLTSMGYGYEWEQRRLHHLRHNPLCVMCKAEGKYVQAAVVDHIIPHKGNQELFWDESNWQSLCKPCHDSRKQSAERLGYDKNIGTDGMPTDPKHPWNRGRAA